MSTDDIIN
jgi:hypothetical protein